MPEIQLGAHTVRSHGVQVLKIHKHDWLILVLLAGLDLGLNIIEPFHRFVGEDMMTDLKYPLQDNTVPFWGVPVCFDFDKFSILSFDYRDVTILVVFIYFSGLILQIIGILLPILVIMVYYFIRRDVYDLHHAILGTSSLC